MKKVLSIALALTLVLCLALSASAAVEIFVDVDFTADGKVVDAKGNYDFTYVNGGYSTIGATKVEHAGKEYTVPAFAVSGLTSNAPSDYCYGVAKDGTYNSIDDYYAVFQKAATIEVFFQNTAPNAATDYAFDSMVFGNTWSAGWAILYNSTGIASAKAYLGGIRCITMTGSALSKAYLNVVDKSATPVYEELTHVVYTWEYDDAAANTFGIIYINGVEAWSEARTGKMFNWELGNYKYLGIGTNYRASKDGTTTIGAANNQCTDLIIVDAKMYSGAATADEVEKMYNDAVAALAAAPAVTPTTTPTAAPTATPTAAPTAAPTTAPTTTPSTPSTGDTGVVVFLAVMAMISMAAVAVVSFKKEH